METKLINLNQLIENNWHTRTTNTTIKNKIKRHIKRHRCYEPLAVRENHNQPDKYEILNGHLRKQILTELGYTHAHCVLWKINQNEGLMALATLNRLNGKDNPVKLAKLLDKLTTQYLTTDLLKAIPQTRKQFVKTLSLLRPIKLLRPEQIEKPRQAITFFVNPRQNAIIDEALTNLKKSVRSDDPQGRLTRGDLLAILSQQANLISNDIT